MESECLYTHYFLSAEKVTPGVSYNIQYFTGPTDGEIV